MEPEFRSEFSLRLRDSAMMIYRNDERGQPCLMPREAWKKSVGQLLIKGAIQGLLIHSEIHLIKVSLNPKRFIILNRKECLTRSNALAMSSLIIIPFSFRVLLEWIAS